jgi:hypothetical protein
MSLLLRYVWFTKVCLTGWSAWKACYGDGANGFICFLSGSYFVVLFLATFVSWKSFTMPRRIDNLEGEYLQRLEEGMAFEEPNQKPE